MAAIPRAAAAPAPAISFVSEVFGRASALATAAGWAADVLAVFAEARRFGA